MKYLLIAEKPSLMRDIESCYKAHKADVTAKIGGEIDFIALSGHVCTNYLPNDYAEWKDKKWNDIEYPMIPDPWKIKAINDKREKETLEKIKKSLPSYDGIICATDSDTEGYGIYYLLEKYLKISKPTLRFIEHSLTDKEILKSLLSMTDFHKDPQHIHATQSFLLRSRADWLFGMNASRVMTNKQGRLCKIGRVKSPTIKLVYDNSLAIENFTPKTYYVVISEYEGFKGILQAEKEDARYEDKSKIPSFPLAGEVADVKSEKAYRNPPKLFDLAAVQAEAGSRFKMKPDRTLDIIQSLYEKHKVISYPRTQCRFVSSEKAKEFPQLLKNIRVFPDLDALAGALSPDDMKRVMADKNVVNDTEVSKESHDALLPTSKKPDLSAMTEDEKNICHLIFSRFLMQFLGKEEGEKTVVKIKHGLGIFKAEGKVIKKKGWTVLYKKQKDVILPALKTGDKITAKRIYPDERKTKAPSRLTQATLINAMRNIATQITDPELKKSLAESQGIGMPSTRTAIIKDIIDTGYVSDKKDGLYITDEGRAYIESVKELDIISPIFAAEMDTSIKKIQRGETAFNDAQDEVIAKLYDMIKQIDSLKKVNVPGALAEGTPANVNCPVCGNPLTVSKFNYECSCGFKVGRQILSHEVKEKELKELCDNKKAGPFTFISKSKKKFSAYLIIDDDNKVQFEFPSAKCPNCGSDMRFNDYGAFCDCGLKVFKSQRGVKLSDAEVKKILSGEKVYRKNFKSKDGKTYSGSLYLDGTEVKIEFEEGAQGKSTGTKKPAAKKPPQGPKNQAFSLEDFSLDDFYNDLAKG